jgi:hypothetical protein
VSDLKLIKNNLSHEERIQHRIDSFRRDILSGDGDVVYVSDILDACYEYLMQYEDEDVFMSTIKIKEAIFYLDNFIRY